MTGVFLIHNRSNFLNVTSIFQIDRGLSFKCQVHISIEILFCELNMIQRVRWSLHWSSDEHGTSKITLLSYAIVKIKSNLHCASVLMPFDFSTLAALAAGNLANLCDRNIHHFCAAALKSQQLASGATTRSYDRKQFVSEGVILSRKQGVLTPFSLRNNFRGVI